MRFVTAVARRITEDTSVAGCPLPGSSTVRSRRRASAAPIPAASRTTAGLTLHTASKERGAPSFRRLLEAGEAGRGARCVAHHGPFPQQRSIVSEGQLGRAPPAQTIASEVGEDVRSGRRSSELPPAGLARTIEALSLEAADEQGPLGLRTALILDGAADGQHRPLRQLVARQLSPAPAQTGEDRRLGPISPRHHGAMAASSDMPASRSRTTCRIRSTSSAV